MQKANVMVIGTLKKIEASQSAVKKTPFRNLQVQQVLDNGDTKSIYVRCWNADRKLDEGKKVELPTIVTAYVSKGVPGLSFDCF